MAGGVLRTAPAAHRRDAMHPGESGRDRLFPRHLAPTGRPAVAAAIDRVLRLRHTVAMQILESPPPDRHTLWEDVHGILIGTLLVALSIQFLRATGLFTGQIAGLALLLSYPTGWPFGLVFFVINLPFYVLAIRQLGWRFTIKSFVSVLMMSTMADAMPAVLTISLPPWLAAILFGVLAGLGLLSLFRHGATLGGVGIVALWLQDTRGIKAGNIQLGFDLCVFVVALFLFPWQTVCWSLLGAVILNAIITINHRRDRYIARS